MTNETKIAKALKFTIDSAEPVYVKLDKLSFEDKTLTQQQLDEVTELLAAAGLLLDKAERLAKKYPMVSPAWPA